MSEHKELPVIGISIGDLNGIGPEVIIKTFSDNRMLDFCTPVIYGNLSALNYHRKALDGRNFNVQQIRDIREAKAGRINLINVWQENVRITVGQPSEETGKYALMSLKAMANDARLGMLDGMVTAPINKHTVHSEEFQFAGHTEFLAKELDARAYLMLMVGEQMKVGVVTGHIPLKEVPTQISPEKIMRLLRLLQQSLIVDFGIRKPKIGVLGLNPHAGEEGLLGNEENILIKPALEQAKEENIIAIGPYPADGYFGMHQYHAFDATLAMYHDQGLAPFKLVHFESGVNYTAGLPVPRTSPDHGTAYDIAGKNIANEQSFREAVYLVCDIIKNRQLYDEVTEDPLENQVIKEKEM